jgi:hypothetical protein
MTWYSWKRAGACQYCVRAGSDRSVQNPAIAVEVGGRCRVEGAADELCVVRRASDVCIVHVISACSRLALKLSSKVHPPPIHFPYALVLLQTSPARLTLTYSCCAGVLLVCAGLI